ncbi:MAG: alanine racemase [Anaerolineales bacterium]
MLYQTHARIHLDNIRANILGVRQAIGLARKLLVSVKANGYGHGAIEIARLAERSGVDWLSVATIPEGIQLRRAGIKLPILKLSPAFPEELEAALRDDLTLTVASRQNIDDLQAACRAANVQTAAHLKLDTGMGRLGCVPEQAPALAVYIESKCPNLRLEGVFTHFPASDEADPTQTRAQTERFKAAVETIQAEIGRRIELVHASNSGGVLAHESAWFDLVRPGIMIYGYYPDPATPRSIALKPGLSFLTRVLFLKKVKTGTPIGYGRTWSAPEDTWIATLPVGYADGFNRLFSNRGRVLINGKSYPVVGRVCMDQIMVNLGPQTDVRVGDKVVLIGRSGEEEITAYEWAEKLGTIPYEATCQINQRVERIYE